ncbi:hypothetical protein MAFF211271_15830 [Ralstonia syzygii subsp. indonesiensis]|nr:hypothetical protein MAFF211271_15830 [Ralstonia pseudosolanacearum]
MGPASVINDDLNERGQAMNKESRQAIIPPYGVAIHDAIVGGDLKKMKALLSHAETVLDEQGDLRTAVELLRLEIARAERA